MMRAGGVLFLFFLNEMLKNDVSEQFPEKFSTFSMCTSQSTNKMAANDDRSKLTIRDVWTIFKCEYWKCNKNF